MLCTDIDGHCYGNSHWEFILEHWGKGHIAKVARPSVVGNLGECKIRPLTWNSSFVWSILLIFSKPGIIFPIKFLTLVFGWNSSHLTELSFNTREAISEIIPDKDKMLSNQNDIEVACFNGTVHRTNTKWFPKII